MENIHPAVAQQQGQAHYRQRLFFLYELFVRHNEAVRLLATTSTPSVPLSASAVSASPTNTNMTTCLRLLRLTLHQLTLLIDNTMTTSQRIPQEQHQQQQQQQPTHYEVDETADDDVTMDWTDDDDDDDESLDGNGNEHHLYSHPSSSLPFRRSTMTTAAACSLSFCSVPLHPNVSGAFLSASPTNMFTLFPHAFAVDVNGSINVDDTDDDNMLHLMLEFYVMVLYNLGLAHHVRGVLCVPPSTTTQRYPLHRHHYHQLRCHDSLVNDDDDDVDVIEDENSMAQYQDHQDGSLSIALLHYKMALTVVHHNATLCPGSNALYVMALPLLNNTGHVFSHTLQPIQARTCAKRLEYLLLCGGGGNSSSGTGSSTTAEDSDGMYARSDEGRDFVVLFDVPEEYSVFFSCQVACQKVCSCCMSCYCHEHADYDNPVATAA